MLVRVVVVGVGLVTTAVAGYWARCRLRRTKVTAEPEAIEQPPVKKPRRAKAAYPSVNGAPVFEQPA